MFWADSRARDAYLTFSDVIVFDVMYRTNRFRMPFAPFTGVNHHRQSTLFGCALIADETEETFTWLFEQWLDCMFGRAPGCIITDMDGAMRNAIRTVFPNTHHRFCSWHISKHLLEHVPLMRDPTTEFSKDYKKWFYTRQKEDCEAEFKDSIDCYHEKVEKSGIVAVYKVGLSVDEKWKWCKVVYDESEGVKATCECAMFETKGILCKHILRIMSKKLLMSIPQQYILNRWTTGVRYRVDSGVFMRELDNNDVSPLHRWCLITKFQTLLDRFKDNNTLFKKVNETLDAWLLDSEKEMRDKEVDLANSGSEVVTNFVSQGVEISIRDPQPVRTKGRPKVATRFKSPIEKSQSQPKQIRRCKKCEEIGHYMTTCGQENKKKQKMTLRDE
ncbi:protein FAR1-RELATED SEQUENCE 5-like [Tasmannia lanceolata]|uniref:protein FAR1-RELATED SEQUENCE 5-like n=1 Tax=Tasmannia lanceolata TaxID=3420 RepID=UPI0040647A7D